MHSSRSSPCALHICCCPELVEPNLQFLSLGRLPKTLARQPVITPGDCRATATESQVILFHQHIFCTLPYTLQTCDRKQLFHLLAMQIVLCGAIVHSEMTSSNKLQHAQGRCSRPMCPWKGPLHKHLLDWPSWHKTNQVRTAPEQGRSAQGAARRTSRISL